MKDAGTELRRGYWLALDGLLTTINGDNVPMYNGKVEDSPPPEIYVLFNEQSEVSKNSMSHFAVEKTLTLDIYQKVPASVTSEDVEYVADQILQIVRPTPRTIGVTIANPFKLIIIKLESNDLNRAVPVESNSYIMTKSLRFTNHIIQ